MEYLFDNLLTIELIVALMIGVFSCIIMFIWHIRNGIDLLMKMLFFVATVASVPIIYRSIDPGRFDITYSLVYFTFMALFFFFITTIWKKTTFLNKFIKVYSFLCSIGAAGILLIESLR